MRLLSDAAPYRLRAGGVLDASTATAGVSMFAGSPSALATPPALRYGRAAAEFGSNGLPDSVYPTPLSATCDGGRQYYFQRYCVNVLPCTQAPLVWRSPTLAGSGRLARNSLIKYFCAFDRTILPSRVCTCAATCRT